MRGLLIYLLTLPVSLAAVNGVVRNQTSGAPQPEALVTVYQLGSTGMTPVKSVKSDAQGAFSIDYTPSGGPHLLQTIHDGVVYNQMMQPGSPSTGLTLAVYDSTAKPQQTAVTQHMILMEPMGGILHINESIIVQNSGKLTYNDSKNGTVRVFLPPEKMSEPRVMITAPQGMPIERPAVATGEDNVYMIDFPVKPGETRFDLTYVLPEPEPKVFAGRILHDGGPVRLVVPEKVTLEADNIKEIGHEPSTHATIFEVVGKEYAVSFSGTGSLSTPEEPPAQGGGGAGIQQIQARINSRAWVVIGMGIAILLLGFLLLYRRGEGVVPPVKTAPKGKRG